jgi:hypothetical protein
MNSSGDPLLVRRAAENTFNQLGWSAKWDNQSELWHYPGGWYDRIASGYVRSLTLEESDYYGPNTISIQYHGTNSAFVALIRTRAYLRFGWLYARERQEARLQKFYESLEREFRKLKFALVDAGDWETAAVRAGLAGKLSPFWKRNQFGYFALEYSQQESTQTN